jgi:hypothetical protein
MNQLTYPLYLKGGVPMLLLISFFYLFAQLISANVLVSALVDVSARGPCRDGDLFS